MNSNQYLREGEPRLKRNYTVSVAHQKRKASRKAPRDDEASKPDVNNDKRQTSALYRQQMSMPSGSFQQINATDYHQKQERKQQREFFEKNFGSIKKKKKSSKNKKNESGDEKPIICPLPR